MKLSSTSSLVLLWAQQECYKTKNAINYLSQLDLEEGEFLFEQCNKIFQYSEVIKNRKNGVMNLIEKCIIHKGSDLQIVIAGAGFDALGIELINLYQQVKVFELDRDNMNIKSAMIAKLNNEVGRRIFFIEVDLLNILDVHKELSISGWDELKPTLLLFEGISYYLPTKSIRELNSTIRPNSVIFEFLKNEENISMERLNIPQKVFGLIAEFCELSSINKFNVKKIRNIFNNLSIEDRYSMMQLEKLRTGNNMFFPSESSGWIEVCLMTDRSNN